MTQPTNDTPTPDFLEVGIGLGLEVEMWAVLALPMVRAFLSK